MDSTGTTTELKALTKYHEVRYHTKWKPVRSENL